jgi:small subunit ribosomal protein S6
MAQRPYELMVLFHPDLEIDLEKALKKVEGLVMDAGGKITTTDVWGKRKLAYKIKNQDFAVYVYDEIEIPTNAIGKLESGLNIADEVLRYLISHPVPKSERQMPDDEENGEDETDDSARPVRATKTGAKATAAAKKE